MSSSASPAEEDQQSFSSSSADDHTIDDNDDDAQSLSSMTSTWSLRDRGLQMWGRLSSSIRGDESFRSESFRQQRRNSDGSSVLTGTASLAVREEERRASQRRLKQQQLEQERRLAQFKKDEAFVMQVMNDTLERDMKAAAKRRALKEKMAARQQQQQHLSQVRAHHRNSRQNEKLKRFLGTTTTTTSHASTTSTSSPIPAKPVRRDSLREFQQHQLEVQRRKLHEHMEDVSGQTAELSSESSAEDLDSGLLHANNSSSEEEEEDYPKTIRWCATVEEELQRRAIHRRTHPTKVGGLARRVRRLPKEPEVPLSEEERKESQTQEDIQDMVAQYREAMRKQQTAVELAEELKREQQDNDSDSCDEEDDCGSNVWSELLENTTLTSVDMTDARSGTCTSQCAVASPTSVAVEL